MDVPGIVEDALDGEDVATRVDLGGDDVLYVTATRTLIYRGEGLLSDESVEAYAHDVERLAVSEGRRKTRLSLTYPIEGTDDFTLPGKSADVAIPPILAGVLNANGVIEPGETVLETFLFSELTMVITENRLVKYIGEAVWDEEFEEYRFADVTGIGEEAGSVATQIVLTVNGRSERIKTPNDRATEVRTRLEEAIRAYHDLGPSEDITAALAPEDGDDGGDAPAEDSGSGMTFEDGIAPLSAGDTTGGGADPDPTELQDTIGGDDGGAEAASDGVEPAPDGAAAETRDAVEGDDGAGSGGDAGGAGGDTTADASGGAPEAGGTAADAGGADAEPEPRAGSADAAGDEAAAAEAADEPTDAFEEAGFEPADDTPDVSEEVAELRDVVQKQNRLLAKQQRTIEKLIEELRRGR